VGFIARLPRNVRYQVVQKNLVPADAAVLADQATRLTSAHSRGRYPELLRLVHYRDPETSKGCVFLTNLPDLPAQTVADLYRHVGRSRRLSAGSSRTLKSKPFTAPRRVAF
jgi:hypothetical protein